MPASVTRTPVEERVPWCYTLHRGDDDAGCAACPHSTACVRATEANRSRQTVAEASQAAMNRYRARIGEPVEVEDLIRLAAELCGVDGQVTRHWLADRSWRSAFTTVVAACQVAQWDPRNFVRAISTTIGSYTVGKGWRPTPSMFSGAKAVERFSRWASANRRTYGDSTGDLRRVEEEREAIIAGECCFAERYLRSAAPLRDCEAWARDNFPKWSLAQTEGRDDVRLPALASALATIDPSLPHRVLVPVDGWSWPDARAAVDALTQSEDESADEEPLELDPELGDLV